MIERASLFYEKQRRMKHNSSCRCQIPQNYNFFQLVWGNGGVRSRFLIRKMQFLSPVFPVFTPFFLSKTLANRLFSHENRVWIWKKVLWIPALPLDDADQSSLRMIGQLHFTPVHKQLITIPINQFQLWRIWSIHQARRVAILLPYIKAFHQFLC